MIIVDEEEYGPADPVAIAIVAACVFVLTVGVVLLFSGVFG